MLAPTLRRCTALVHLDLSNTGLRTDGTNGIAALTAVLSGLTALRHLDLRINNFHGVGPDFVAVYTAVVHCPVLTHLNLSASALSDEDMAGLVSVLWRCRVVDLDLSGNSVKRRATDVLVAVIPHCPSLARLDLRWCFKHGDEDMRELMRPVWVAGVNGVPHATRSLRM